MYTCMCVCVSMCVCVHTFLPWLRFKSKRLY